jgi:signal transduction histidine kinase
VGDPAADPAARAEQFARSADLGAVVSVLVANREEVLAGWLAAAGAQSFHAGRREHAVADHVPRLFDALVALLRRSAPVTVDAPALLEDPAAFKAAQDHALARLTQGLTSAEVVTEFRLLRQEIGRALRRHLAVATSTSDVVAAELLVHDALDASVFVALSTLGAHEDERRRLYEEAHRARAEAEVARAQAEDAVRIRDQVLAAVAHDLRTPLTAIRGQAQLLSRRARRPGGPPAEALAAGLEQIERASQRMARWLDALSDVGRLQIGQALPLNRRPTNVVELAAEVLAEHQVASPRHQLRLETAVPELFGEWDAARLERALHNLIGNAVKFSPEGGEVAVAITRETSCGPDQPDAPLHPGASKDTAGDCAVVRVRDQGLGIPPADLAFVFEPFRRGANVTDIIDGTGIGLATVRQTVVAHGGTVTVASQEGAGSTFTVCLPLLPAAPPEPPTE